MYKNISFEIPKDAAYILDLLKRHNFEAFMVGGCVRDAVINRSPQDWDIATSATPEKVKEIFPKTIDTGLKHGTVTVLLNNIAYEVTTYRIEGRYINNRQPETVEFTDSIEADLSRRDFTINSMAYNSATGLIDPFGGLDDIEAKQIKAVGVADHRFQEDALRMLRAVRFSAQLGYQIEESTLQAIKKHCSLLNNISGERIRDELNKILLADPMVFQLLHHTGILRQIIPELDICFEIEQQHPYHIYNVGMHSLHAANNIESSLLLRWTMLLHDIGKPMAISTDSKGLNHFYMHQKLSAEKAEIILQRLRFDNASIVKIKKLILEHDRQIGDTEKSIRKAIAAIGVNLFEDWMQVRLADINAQNPDKAFDRITTLHAINITYNKIIAEKQCLSLMDLALTGRDLMDMGFPQGKDLGDALKKLLDSVLEQPELNERNRLLKLAMKLIKKGQV